MRRSASSPVRTGLIGYGLGGEYYHAPVLAATPGVRIAAIVTSDRERAGRAARAHPDAAVVPSADALWEMAPLLDLVVVATPNRTHVPVAERALAEGLAVVVDKPIAPTADEGRRLVAAAKAAGRLLTVYHNRRWDGDFLTVRRLLGEGALGDVRRFESRFELWRPVPKPGWRQAADPAAAGGVLFDLGSHLIDQALLLFGPAHRVYAELDRRAEGDGADDDAFVALMHASGVRSHLWMSTAAAQRGPRFRVLGSRAGFTKHGMDVQEAALRTGARPGGAGWGEDEPERWGLLGVGDELEPVRTEPGDYVAFYRGVAAALREGAPPPVDPADAVEAVRIIELARRSAADGGAMDVPPVA